LFKPGPFLAIIVRERRLSHDRRARHREAEGFIGRR
jgi:hypothetical protein